MAGYSTAVFADTLAHRLVEVLEAVLANAAGRRGDVGGVHRADRRFHRQAAGEGLAALGGVAGHAVTGAGQVFACASSFAAACAAAPAPSSRVAINIVFMLIAPQA
jgi:hypothetical protein